MNPGMYISRSARFWPDETAVIFRELRFSYLDLDRRTNRLARGLTALGLQKGDRVAVYSWNRHEILELEVACYKTGLVKVPINARLSAREAVHVVNDSGASVVLADSHHAETLAPVMEQMPSVRVVLETGAAGSGTRDYEAFLEQQPEVFHPADVSEDDIAVLHYTSGTSGKLKAAVQTFGNRTAFIRKTFMIPGGQTGPGDIFALIGPITHATGMNIMPLLFTGGCALILEKFDVEQFLQLVEREKVTHTFMVPTMINMVLNHPRLPEYDTSSLKRIVYGAAPMSPTRVSQAIERFGPILVQGYGAGETTSIITVLTEKEHEEALRMNEKRLASCGRPRFDTEVRILDEDGREAAVGEIGEIVVRGPDIMQGYWQAPELTAEVLKEGWYYTGDLAKTDEDGFIYIVDRKKEMIISGGFNIYPTEIESVLYTHPAVFEACVIGIPDRKWGEAVKAFVVLKEDKVVSEDELIDYCAGQLAGFKKPGSIEFVNTLPKNPNGKIVRRLVREKYWSEEERRV